MKDIVIVGSGGFAKEVAFLIEEINKHKKEWNFLGYIDQSINCYNGKYKVYQNDQWLLQQDKNISVVFGIGDPILVEKLYIKFLQNKALDFPNLLHPNLVVDSTTLTLGKGNIICASNTFTTDISLGDFNIINLDCTIGHDVKMGDFNILNPSVNVSGSVSIGSKNLIGTHATILQNLNIKSQIVIGAAALLTKSALEPGVYIGSPAKKR